MIPDEAVEAAAKRLATIGGQPHNWANYKAPARAALEAAAPHMLAGVESIAAKLERSKQCEDREIAEDIRAALGSTT